jgi:predicted O-methyltransferase YrrM
MKPTMLQEEAEIDWLATIVRVETVRSVLEIGSRFGESLRRLVLAMPPGSKAVSVDLLGNNKGILRAVISALTLQGYDAHVVFGDSTDPDVVEQVRALGPYDLIFIDANHTLPYVTKDWENYGPMGRIVAFHDIAWRRPPEWKGIRIDVPQFWESIKHDYRHSEMKVCPSGQDNGIGVLWRS